MLKRQRPCLREHCGGTLDFDVDGDLFCILCGRYPNPHPAPYIPPQKEGHHTAEEKERTCE